MAGIMTIEGDRLAVGFFLGTYSTPGTYYLRLFTNNHTPTDTDTSLGTYTEATAAGYAGVALNPANWTHVESGGTGSTWEYPTVTWIFTAGETIYGYWIDNASDVMWAELAPGGPIVVPSGGGVVQLTPSLLGHTCP